MSFIAWVPCLVAVAGAAAAAAADGGLLGTGSAGDDRERALLPAGQAERLHRALAIARVALDLIAGVAFATAVALPSGPPALRVAAVILFPFIVAGLADGVSRASGYSFASRTLSWLLAPARLVSSVLAVPAAVSARLEFSLANAMLETITGGERETNAEQFREVVTAEAEISGKEQALLQGAFSLAKTAVRDIMVPRVDIVGIEIDTHWSEVLDRVRSSEHARLPVYSDTLDNVVGVLYAKDLLGAVIAEHEPDTGWRSLARPAVFIPVSKAIGTQLVEFKTSGTHIAIVTDEYGGTAGLVTIEDVLEEIVGEIRDEHDVEEANVEREGNSHFWVAGRVPLADLVELLHTSFDAESVKTVGGLVYQLFGRVPRAGESIERDGYKIVVERVRHRRIERVYFERLEPLRSRPFR